MQVFTGNPLLDCFNEPLPAGDWIEQSIERHRRR